VSAADVNADVLEHLRRGDEVFVTETLKECSETLATILDKMRGLFAAAPAALKETLATAYARLLADPDAIEQPPEQLFPEKAAA
jgi:hypothetical protein